MPEVGLSGPPPELPLGNDPAKTAETMLGVGARHRPRPEWTEMIKTLSLSAMFVLSLGVLVAAYASVPI